MILELYWTDLTNQLLVHSHLVRSEWDMHLRTASSIRGWRMSVGERSGYLPRGFYSSSRWSHHHTKNLHLGATHAAPERQKLRATPDFRSDII